MRTLGLVALLGLSVIGCGSPNRFGEDENAGTVDESVLAGTRYVGSSCSPEHRTVIRHAGILARTIARSDAFEECLENAMLNGDGPLTSVLASAGPYRPCQLDPHRTASAAQRVQRALAVARSANFLEADCQDLGEMDTTSTRAQTGFEPASDYGHSGAEDLTINTHFLTAAHGTLFREDDEPHLRLGFSILSGTTGLAASLVHEASHTHGYVHDGTGINCTNQELHESVPHIIGACIAGIYMDSSSACEQSRCVQSGGRIALIDDLDSDTCECVRDPSSATNPSLNDPATPVLDTNELGDSYGFSFARGDFNGDGFDDLAVGATGESSNRGAVFIYQGTVFGLYPWKRFDGSSLAGFSLAPGDYLGFSLASGDFNDDGFDDLAVGMPQSANPNGSGFVFAFTGSVRGLFLNARLDQQPRGANEAGDEFGYALAAGDFDGDGADDLAVGTPGEAPASAPRAGYAYVLRGQPESEGAVLSMWAGLRQSAVDSEADGERFGEALAAGFLSSHMLGSEALVIGAPDDGSRGKVFVFTSTLAPSATSWTPDRGFRPSNLTSGARFGSALSVGRYLSVINSGLLAVGAPWLETQFSTQSGGVFVFDSSGTQRHQIIPTNSLRLFGTSLATANVDDDGLQDLVIGEGGFFSSNIAHVRFGGTLGLGITLDQDVMGADEVGDIFGWAVTTGDFDGDDHQDIAVSAPGEAPAADPAFSGHVYTYRGASNRTFVPLAGLNQED